jgi:hypothetical protein
MWVPVLHSCGLYAATECVSNADDTCLQNPGCFVSLAETGSGAMWNQKAKYRLEVQGPALHSYIVRR